mmetsp:Transcript_69416/g.196799  ORF Transcript_69416/g.196799 Transcript_69416/m.196799 type:complete len:206 (+) Transcript_69416:1417-2034(+)
MWVRVRVYPLPPFSGGPNKRSTTVFLCASPSLCQTAADASVKDPPKPTISCLLSRASTSNQAPPASPLCSLGDHITSSSLASLSPVARAVRNTCNGPGGVHALHRDPLVGASLASTVSAAGAARDWKPRSLGGSTPRDDGSRVDSCVKVHAAASASRGSIKGPAAATANSASTEHRQSARACPLPGVCWEPSWLERTGGGSSMGV